MLVQFKADNIYPQGKYRNTFIIYRNSCIDTSKCYMYTAQQKEKTAIMRHFSDGKCLSCDDVHSDIYASYFFQFFNSTINKLTPVKLK